MGKMGIAILYTEKMKLKIKLDEDVIMRWIQEALLTIQLKKNEAVVISDTINDNLPPEKKEMDIKPENIIEEKITKTLDDLKGTPTEEGEKVVERDEKIGEGISMPPSELEKIKDTIKEEPEKKKLDEVKSKKTLKIFNPEEKKERILYLLKQGKLTGGELARKLSVDGRGISKTLYFLCQVKSIKTEVGYPLKGKGRIIYYSLNLEDGEGESEEVPYISLREKLRNLAEEGLPNTRSKILKILGMGRSGVDYVKLREVAELEGVELPERIEKQKKEITTDTHEEKPLSEEEKRVIEAVGNRRNLKVKVIRNRLKTVTGEYITSNEVRELVDGLVKKGYLTQGRHGKKGRLIQYSKFPVKEVMEQYYINHLTRTEIASDWNIPTWRVSEIISRERATSSAMLSTPSAPPDITVKELFTYLSI